MVRNGVAFIQSLYRSNIYYIFRDDHTEVSVKIFDGDIISSTRRLSNEEKNAINNTIKQNEEFKQKSNRES